MKNLNYIKSFFIFKGIVLFLIILFSTQQAKADCFVDTVQFDIGGRVGSGVTAVNQGNPITLTEIINLSVNFKSQSETEYAMSVDGSEDLKAGFDISKNINGFDLSFNANQSLSENSDQSANVSLSRSF